MDVIKSVMMPENGRFVYLQCRSWMDGWMDGQLDKQTDRQAHIDR